MRRVAVVEAVQVSHEDMFQKSLMEVYYGLTRELLKKTNLSKDEIETVIESSSDYWRGIACSNIHTVEATTGYLKELSKVEQDGIYGFLYAYMRILSGIFDTALVISDTKCSEVDAKTSNLSNLTQDPIYLRRIGIDEISVAAIQAQLYMEKYNVKEEEFAKVVVKNLKNGLNNPYASRKARLKIEDVLNSEMLAYPIKELMCAPYSDGACAILLASEEKAKDITDTPVWINGVGWSTDHYILGDRDLIGVTSLKIAANKAYKMSGIENPLKEIDVAEISEPFAPQELLWYEGLNFCVQGRGHNMINDGVTEIEGELPVNPSGGVLATNPYVARGLLRVAEAYMQVAGKAGKHQIDGAEIALAHGMSGVGGQTHAVVILGR